LLREKRSEATQRALNTVFMLTERRSYLTNFVKMMVRSRDFSVLHVNTRSMIAHINTMILDEINVLAAEYKFDVICLLKI